MSASLDERRRSTAVARWAVAALGLAAVAAAGVFASSGGDGRLAVFDESGPSSSAAEDLGYLYVAKYAEGDLDGLLALLSSDVRYAVAAGPVPAGAAAAQALDLDGVAMEFAWNIAQGTSLTLPLCSSGESGPDLIEVTCRYGTYDSLALASDAPPVSTTTRLMIAPNGIVRVDVSHGEPGFSLTSPWFVRWMLDHHEEDLYQTEAGSWATRDEATDNGARRARYALEWGVHLAANNCGFREESFSYGCTFSPSTSLTS